MFTYLTSLWTWTNIAIFISVWYSAKSRFKIISRCNSIFSICFQQSTDEPLYIIDAIMKGVVDHSSGQNQTSLLKKVLDRVKLVLNVGLPCRCLTSLVYQMEKNNITANNEAWVSLSFTGSSREIFFSEIFFYIQHEKLVKRVDGSSICAYL